MTPTVWIIGDETRFPNYYRALRRAGAAPCYGVPNDGGAIRRNDCGAAVRDCGAVRPEDCDALLLPGGGDMEPWRYGQENTASRNLDPARDALELDLLERFAALRKPILGICRGMQSINVFFGGTLFQDIPNHTQINGVDRVHEIRTASGIFRTLGAERVNSAHHQAADRLGDGLRVGQWAPDGVIEAIYHERWPIWGVQWHPERLDAPAGDRLFRAFASLCADV